MNSGGCLLVIGEVTWAVATSRRVVIIGETSVFNFFLPFVAPLVHRIATVQRQNAVDLDGVTSCQSSRGDYCTLLEVNL